MPAVHLRFGPAEPLTACGLPVRDVQHASQHPALVTCPECRRENDAHPERALTYMPRK